MIETTEINFTDSSYCNIGRNFLTLLGPWPYQKPVTRNFRASIVMVFVCLSIIPQIVKLVASFEDMDSFTATLSPLTCAFISITKFWTLIIHNSKLRNISDTINENWRTLRIREEMDIMEKHVTLGKLHSTIYSVYISMAAVPFCIMALQPMILDYFIPLNESRPLKTIYPATYYFIDEEEYFLVITFHMSLCGATVIGMVIASDSMYLMYGHYICGMFAIVGNRLECTLYKRSNATTLIDRQKDICHRYIKECVRLHCKTLWLVSTMETIFSFSCLIQLGLSVLCLSVTLVQVVVLLGHFEVMRFVLFAIGQIISLFCLSYQGQNLIDCSSETFDQIYAGSWYNMPIETQKILLFILHRTSKPCCLTAGKLFIYSMERFSMVVQTCMSYFMVLVSFR